MAHQPITENCRTAPERVHEHISTSSELESVVLLLSPCRSGSSALLETVAPFVDMAYYQPLKDIVRHGGEFHLEHRLVFIKETFGPWHSEEATFNPVQILLDAGVPPEIITVTALLRDPFATYSSWLEWCEGVTYEVFQSAYKNAIRILEAIPETVPASRVVYESFIGKELDQLNSLFVMWGLGTLSDTGFRDTYKNSRVWLPGETDSEYYQDILDQVMGRGGFVASFRDSTNIPAADFIRIQDELLPLYLHFAQNSLNGHVIGNGKFGNIGRLGVNADTGEILGEFGRWAPTYDGDMVKYGWSLPRAMAEILMERVSPSRGDVIADMAAGTGLVGEEIKRLTPELELHGVDISRDMLLEARKKAAYAALILDDLTDSRLPSGEYDFVISAGTLGIAPVECLDTFSRVVKPGGEVLFSIRERAYLDPGAGFKDRVDSLDLVSPPIRIKGDNRAEGSPFLVFHYRV